VALDRSLRGMAIRPPLNITALRDRVVKPDEVREAVFGWLAANTGWLVVIVNADSPQAIVPYVPCAATARGGHVLVTSWPRPGHVPLQSREAGGVCSD
jgi:hypothetical protein